MNKCQSRVEPDSLNKHQWGKDPDSLNKSWSGQDPKALNKCQWGQEPDAWGCYTYLIIFFKLGSSPSGSDPNPASGVEITTWIFQV